MITIEPWIKLYKKFTNWEWYTETNVKVVFLHLLLTANWKPKKWKGIVIDKGEVVTSTENIAAEVGLSPQKVRTAIKKLVDSEVISKKATNKYTAFKILNYRNYQGIGFIDNKQITNKQQSKNIPPTTTKEYKNNKNKEYSIYSMYEKNIGLLTDTTAEIIGGLIKRYGAELTELAILEAVKANVAKISYIEGILNNWNKSGVKTADDAIKEIEQFRNGKKIKAKPKKNSFQNYSDSDITDLDIKIMQKRLANTKED